MFIKIIIFIVYYVKLKNKVMLGYIRWTAKANNMANVEKLNTVELGHFNL